MPGLGGMGTLPRGEVHYGQMGCAWILMTQLAALAVGRV